VIKRIINHYKYENINNKTHYKNKGNTYEKRVKLQSLKLEKIELEFSDPKIRTPNYTKVKKILIYLNVLLIHIFNEKK